jgi:ubiquinone/menaquinone biosynthesis C-methylase UbiE
MSTESEFQKYAARATTSRKNIDNEVRNEFVNVLGDCSLGRVLDVGCGAGYDLLPFVEIKNAHGFGVDISENLGEVSREFIEPTGFSSRVSFSRCDGRSLPFANESFDVVLCMVALPYMNNANTISEIARVLRPEGFFFLKIHSPWFYFTMIKKRFAAREIKSLIYPLISLFMGSWYRISGNQLEGGIWNGKEMFQTESMIRNELAKKGLKIVKKLPSYNKDTPSFLVRKG